MFEVTKFFIWAFWLNFSRFNFVYLVYELILFGIIGKYYIPVGYIVFIILSYVALISVEAAFFYYFYLKVKKMERTWDDFSVHRIKEGSISWNKVQCSDIKVGDLVLLKHGTVAPADILIIDTSDTHFSEQILSTNERRVTGSNKMTIKRAVKNMRAKSSVKNPNEAIKNILPILEGQLEYEPPSQTSINFSGTFKLNNDPQISKFTHKNVLFCGTKLHTSWMMGIVLYTGKDTKIIQKNMLEWSMMKKIRAETKVSKANSFINWIFIIYMLMGLLIAALVLMQINFETKSDQLADVIENFYLGKSNGFTKVALIIHGSTVNIPHLVVLIYEICCFVFGIRIQSQQQVKLEDMVKQAENSISETKVHTGRRSGKKKSTKLTGDATSVNQGWKKPKLNEDSSISQIEKNSAGIRSPESAAMRPAATYAGRKRTSKDVISGQSSPDSTVRKTTINRMGTMATIKTTKKEEADELDHQVKVINYEALPDLGCINHVVFDKTDTLTKETVQVCQIATCDKIYEIDGESNLKELMIRFTKHPGDFEFEEDEEEKKAKENSFYSEKSQEYLKEIQGEFHVQVHSDNETDMGINLEGAAFDTILRGGNHERDGSLESENYSMGSKMKAMSAHTNNFGDGERGGGYHKLQLVPLKQAMISSSSNPTSGPIKLPAKIEEFKTSQPHKDADFDFDGDDSFLQLEMLELQFKKAQKAQKQKVLEEKKKEKTERELKEKERLKKEKLKQQKAEAGSNPDLNQLNSSQDEDDSKHNESDDDLDKLSQENSKNSKEGENEEDRITRMHKGPQIRLKVEKILTDKHLVADIRNRSESLEELLTNLLLLHLMEYGTTLGDEKYLRPEDEAIHEIIVSLGFNQTKTAKAILNQHAQYEKTRTPVGGVNNSGQSSKQKDNSGKSSMKSMNNMASEVRNKMDPNNMQNGRHPRHQLLHTVYSYDIETIGGLKVQTKVFAMNIFSQNRKRKSIITNCFTGNDSYPFQLVAVGSDKSMRHVLSRSMNRKAQNQLSILFAKIKQRGLKMMIVAKKGLTEFEVQNYTKEYSKISNSARDQIDDLEKLAAMMEVDMEFVGCVALRENIREDAVHLIKELEKANMPISIMSGDELENCLTVVEKLKISQVNIKDSSTFYGIRSRNERGIMQEMRRIFDDVYDMLQNQNYLYMDKMLKMEKEELKKQDTYEDENRRAEPTAPQPTEEQQSVDDDSLEGSPTNKENKKSSSADVVRQLKKPLLLPGDSTEVIMRSKTLTYHLRSVISISSSVIAYDLNPDHKAFLIEQMKKCGLTILAIGDGFNDIGMLTCADIGIQISSQLVPLVFGDIVVPDLFHVAPLIFEHGFRINKNLLMGFVLLMNVVTFTFIYPIFAMQSTLYTLIVTGAEYAVSMIVMPFLPILIFTIVNQPYSIELLQKIPALYQENAICNRHMPKVLSVFFVNGIIEGVVSGMTLVLFTNYELTKEGYPTSLMTDISYLTYLFALSVTTKSLMFLSQKNWSTVSSMLIPAFVWLIVLLFMNLLPAFNYSFAASGYRIMGVGLVSAVIVYLVTSFFSGALLAEYQRSYFHRGATLLQKFLKTEEIIVDANTQMMKYLSHYDMEDQNVFLKLVRGIKKPFKDLAYMDNSLRKIINIDFYNSNMGLSKFINLIIDEDERKKFGLFFAKSINRSRLRIFLAALTTMVGVTYLLVVLYKRYSVPAAFDSILPYCIIGLILIFVAQEWKPKHSFKILKCRFL